MTLEPSNEPPAAPPPAAKAAMPAPTFAPVALAMGLSMTFWGLMAVSLNIGALWFMSVGGALVSAWALRRWIGEIVLAWEQGP